MTLNKRIIVTMVTVAIIGNRDLIVIRDIEIENNIQYLLDHWLSGAGSASGLKPHALDLMVANQPRSAHIRNDAWKFSRTSETIHRSLSAFDYYGIFGAVVSAGCVRLDLFTCSIFTRRNRSAKCSIFSR